MCLLFIISVDIPIVNADSEPISEVQSTPSAEYFWDNTTTLSTKYHYATSSEIDKMKETIGVYDSNKNYNILVDGHGTGLTPPTLKDWEEMEGELRIQDGLMSSPQPITNSLDLSASLYFPQIGDQGSQGTCAAWAMTYYAYGFIERKDQSWTTQDNDELMSPAWTYNMVNGGIDDGSWMWENAQIIRDWGCPTLYDMPYDDADYISWGNEIAFKNAPEHRAQSYSTIPFSINAVTNVKNLLISETPITFSIDANEFNSDLNNRISSVEYNSDTQNHAQTIVGYDDTITEDGETGAFRVANSWGTGFKDGGFYWLTYDAFNEIGTKNLLFLTYIIDIPNYSPSLTAVWEFSSFGTRDTFISVGIGDIYTSMDSRVLCFDDGAHNFPSFMCIDITEFDDEYISGTTDFFLQIGSGTTSSTISEFWVEYYNWSDGATYFSLYSLDTPETTPGYVTVSGTFSKKPTVIIHIEAINKIDEIDGLLEGGADWYYYAGLYYNTKYKWASKQIPGAQQDYVIANRDHKYQPSPLFVYPIIMLCEEDTTGDDYADISSDSYGGADNVAHPIVPPVGSSYYGSYHGNYDLRTNSLTGDTWVWNSGYRLTSGSYDGSTSVDENDAAVWFDITDNYELPMANAGGNRIINTAVSSNRVSFNANSSTASQGSSLVSYLWNFGDGSTSTDKWKSHEYLIDGVYTVSLTVTDNFGEFDIDTCSVTVQGSKVHNFARAKTYYKIQYALNDAEAKGWSGDTINVDSGTFTEDIEINIPLNLIGFGIDETFLFANDYTAIYVSSDYVDISGLNICGEVGIDVYGNNCVISDNSITAQIGIAMNALADSSLSNNQMFGCSILLFNLNLGDYENLIISQTNTVDGRPVHYIKDASGIPIPPNAGEVILVNCTNMNIRNQNFHHSTVGFEVVFSNNIMVNNTNASSNFMGGLIMETSNSTLFDNSMYNNNGVGLYLLFNSQDNIIRNNIFANNERGVMIIGATNNWFYHNSFTNNINQAIDEEINHWDKGYPSGGNYWSDYTGTDVKYGSSQNLLGSDGIGDIPYSNVSGQGITSGSNKDNYPLMTPGDYEDIIAPSSKVDYLVPYWRSTSNLVISATACDTRDGLANVELWYSFEGGAYQLFGMDILSPWEWTFDWPDGEGNYTFYSIAEDLNSNVEAVPTTYDESVVYDVTSPTSAINEITSYWHDSMLIIEAVGTDETSDVASIELYYRYSADNVSWNNWASFALDSIYPWSWNFTFHKGEGNYEFYSVAIDKAGNIETKSTTAEAICAYDTGPPEIIDNTQATAITGGNFTFGATVQDGISVTSVYVLYRFGTGAATNITLVLVSPNTYEFENQIPLNCTDNLYYIITSVDHLGKWNSTSEKTITVIDNVAPSANAGLDQTVVESSIVTFNGTGSSDNINIINYTWSFSTSRSIVTLYGSNPQYNFTDPGNYIVSLIVTDASGNFNRDILNITVLLDTDGDGIGDNADAFLNDPAASVDTDGDGYPDTWNPGMSAENSTTNLVLDAFPDNPNKWEDTEEGGIGDYWWIIPIIMALLILLGVIVFRMRGKRGPEEPINEGS